MIDITKVREVVKGLKNIRWYNNGLVDSFTSEFMVVDETINELERLQKKETPFKPEATLDLKGRLDFICPYCKRREIVMYDKYCCNCGQKLDWSK